MFVKFSWICLKHMTVLSHDLLIAKLEVFGLDISSLNFLLD